MTKESKTGKAIDFDILWRILKYLKPYKKWLVIAFITTVTLAAVSPIRPWLVQYVLDKIIIPQQDVGLRFYASLMVLLLASETILQYFDSYFSSLLGQHVIRDIRTQTYNKLSRLKLTYFDNTPIGMLVTRTISDTEAIADVFSQGFLVIAGDILKLIVLITVMTLTDWRLTLFSLSTIPILIIATRIFQKGVKKTFQEARKQVANLNSFTQEHIIGMSIVQIFNKENDEFKKFDAINKEHAKANIKSIWYYSVFFPIVEILSSLSIGLIVWWGAGAVLRSEVSLGNLVAFIMYINMLFRPIRMMADRFNTLQMGIVSAERVFFLLDTAVEEENTGTIINDKLKGKIEFKNVWFAYKENNWVLKDVSFVIETGETCAIVGHTGSGKSTIIGLINRFYDIQKGEILIDNIPIKNYDLQHLRSCIALVLQDVFLFSESIRNNLSLNKEYSEKEINEALENIGVMSFIEKLPNGIDYNVMERGSTLSLGQRQLLSFARAYLTNPSVLMLDEATSSIDSESEQLIQHATDTLTQNRTSIIVAHRISTIKKANKIIVVNAGKIVEQGNHLELINKNGYYKELLDANYTFQNN